MKLFMKRHQETFGHEESKIPLFFFEFEFWAFFGGTMGVGARGFGVSKPNKKWPKFGGSYESLLFRNIDSKFPGKI